MSLLLNGKEILTVSTDESKGILKNYEELWTKIRDLIRSKTNILNDYDEKFVFAFKENARTSLIVVRVVFREDNKYYWQVF